MQLPGTASATRIQGLEGVERHVRALAGAIEAKDPCTSEHLLRVATISEQIAIHLGMSEPDVGEVRLAGMLHDLGKLWIKDQVLKKESALDEEEWEHMKQHPRLGWETLAGVPGLKRVSDGMLLHHERIDGLGYPLGLAGEEIPLLARIIAVADTFDAMTSDRPYRKALDDNTAFEEIVRNSGTQFCEKVVDGFVRAFKIDRMAMKRLRDGD